MKTVKQNFNIDEATVKQILYKFKVQGSMFKVVKTINLSVDI